VRFFWIDDIYVTGLLVESLDKRRRKAEEPPVRRADLSGRYVLSPHLLGDRLAQTRALFAHVPRPAALRRWFFAQQQQRPHPLPALAKLADAALDPHLRWAS